MSGIKLPVTVEMGCIFDANGFEVDPEEIAAALNAAPKQAFENLTIRELYEMIDECGDSEEAFLARLQAFAAPIAPAWQPIETAPRNRTPILARFKDNLVHIRPDLIKWEGKCCVVNHVGVLVDGFDIGWGVDAPVGYGGIPDEWIAGWQPLPTAPEAQEGAEHG